MSVVSETHFGIARKIVSNMTVESWTEIPHAVIMYEADVTELMKEYKKLNEGVKNHADKITINTVMLKCIIEGLKSAPKLNSHLEFNKELVRGCLKCYDNINISMPMMLPNGEMMTVNLHNTENKTLTQITESVQDKYRRALKTNIPEVMYEVSYAYTIQGLKKGKVITAIKKLIGAKTGKHKIQVLKGKEKKEYYSIPGTERLTKHDIEQGTTTVSNLGSIYRGHKGSCSLLEIIPPQTTAFAIDAAQKKPVAVTDEFGNDKIEIRTIMPITIAIDHRALDYNHVVPFMERLDEILAEPSVIQSWK